MTGMLTLGMLNSSPFHAEIMKFRAAIQAFGTASMPPMTALTMRVKPRPIRSPKLVTPVMTVFHATAQDLREVHAEGLEDADHEEPTMASTRPWRNSTPKVAPTAWCGPRSAVEAGGPATRPPSRP